MGRVADGVDRVDVEICCLAVVPLGDRGFYIPAKPQIDGQLGCDAPVILQVNGKIMLGVKRIRIARKVAALREAEQESPQCGAVADAAADNCVLARPVGAEIELSLVANPSAGLLQDPDFSAVFQSHVDLHLRHHRAPGVVRGVRIRAGIAGAEIPGKPGDIGE